MARIDVLMPSMGESLAEGTLAKWFKKVGDAVKRDETIFEISTDKVDSEVQAVSAGVLAEILVKEGETVPVNAVVARLETDASALLQRDAPRSEGRGGTRASLSLSPQRRTTDGGAAAPAAGSTRTTHHQRRPPLRRVRSRRGCGQSPHRSCDAWRRSTASTSPR